MNTEDLMKPRFKVIPEIESGMYSVCDGGFVVNNKTGKELKTYLNKKKGGYVYVKLQDGIRQKSFHVGVLVARAFVPNPENKKTVNHDDGNKLNNHWTNIKWNTHKENSEHAFLNGLGKSGLEHYNSKFSLEDITEIKQLIEKGVKRFEIARTYNVSETAIDNIAKGRTYKNLKPIEPDLLRPRFKVGEPYPFSTYTQGDVITTGVNSQLYRMFIQFPKNFIPLSWWEDRKIEDMPEYVKCLGFVRKFKKWHHQENGMVQLYDYPGEIGYEDDISKEVRERGYEIYVITDCLPSTETEYLNQKT